MVDITPLIPADRQVLEGYGDGGFKISGARHEGSLIIFPDQVFAWSILRFDEVDLDSLAAVWATEPHLEILLLGCGATMEMPSVAFKQAVRAAGPVLEPMLTGAACRTFNVLMAEGRSVAGALIAVD